MKLLAGRSLNIQKPVLILGDVDALQSSPNMFGTSAAVANLSSHHSIRDTTHARIL